MGLGVTNFTAIRSNSTDKSSFVFESETLQLCCVYIFGNNCHFVYRPKN
jgi:hypothetical protein